MQLRDYQEKGIRDAASAYAGGANGVILCAFCGAGKTAMGAEITRRAVARGRRICWVAHRKELIEQASERMDLEGIPHGVIKRGHWRYRPRDPVQIASIQTLIRREYANTFDFIIYDEAHRCMGSSYVRVREANRDAKILGLTATPYRLDGKGLGHLFDAIVEPISVAELIERGILVQPRVYAPSAPDLSGVRTTAGDYNRKDLAERTDRATLVGDIVTHWQRLAPGRMTVCFATSIQHSRHIVERFLAAGVTAEHLDGETPDAERDAILRRLESGETLVVSNVGVWIEGVDIPAISCVILARPTKSLTYYIQAVGRGLRSAPGKADVVVLDHAGCTAEHGFVTDEREWSLSGEDRAAKRKRDAEDTGPGVWICTGCYAANVSTERECWSCGAPAPSQRPIREVEGELVEIRPGAYKLPKELSKNPQVAECQRIAALMGYKGAWVSRQAYRISQGLEPQIPERVWAIKSLVEEGRAV